MFSRLLLVFAFLVLGAISALAEQQPISSRQLPLPTATSIGAVFSGSAPSGQFVNAIGVDGKPKYGAITNAQVTAALGYVPASVGAVVTSFNLRAGSVTLQSADVTTALGFLPLSNATSVTVAGKSLALNSGSVALAAEDMSNGVTGTGAIVLANGGVFGIGNATGLTYSQVVAALGFVPGSSSASITIAGHAVALGGSTTLAAGDLTNGTVGTGAVVLANGGVFSIANATGLTSTQIINALGYTPPSTGSVVTAFNTRSGGVTLLSGDVVTALGFTPLSNAATATVAGKSLTLNGGSISLASTDLTDTADLVRVNANQTFTKAQRPSVGTLSLVSNVATPDFDAASDFVLTLACACTLDNPSTTLVVGQAGTITLRQDGAGSRTVPTWGSYYKFPGGNKPTLTSTAGHYDVLSYKVTGASEITITPAAMDPQ